MLRKGHILAILVIAVSFVTVPAFAQEMGFYENILYDFSFEVPTDWKYIENRVTANGEPIKFYYFQMVLIHY